MGGLFGGGSSGKPSLIDQAVSGADKNMKDKGAADLADASTAAGQSTTPTEVGGLKGAGELRSSATMQKQIQTFQDAASTRPRAGGAAVLAGNAGSAMTGTKKLLGS